MCNRFRSIRDWSQMPPELQQAVRVNFDFNPNVAPTEIVPAIMSAQATVLPRFGIDRGPGRDGKPRASLKNARTDGLRRSQFAKLLRGRRCIVPCEGFYEWREEDGRQPYLFERSDRRPLMLAAIWDDAEYKGDRRPAFAILTDVPNALIAPYHDRMPVALADDMVGAWLDPATPAPLDLPLLLELDAFAVRPMDRALNSVRQKALSAIDPEEASRDARGMAEQLSLV